MKPISKFRMKSLVAAFSFMILISIFSDCSKSDSSPGAANTSAVSMQNIMFTPGSITVAPNTTVTWTNKDGFAHNVTSDNGLFNSGNVNGGSSFTFKFDSAGTYTYHCTIHPGMVGTVVVK